MQRILTCCLVIVLVSLGSAPAWAQTADDYFHEGAQQYLAEEYDQALQTVNAGLQVDPDNVRLQTLREHLEDLEQQPGGDGADDADGTADDEGDAEAEPEEDEGDAEDTNGADDAEDDAAEDEMENGEGDDAEGEDEAPDTPAPSEDRPDELDAPDADQELAEGAADASASPHRMSRIEALRLLDTIESQELQLLREHLQHEAPTDEVDKPW